MTLQNFEGSAIGAQLDSDGVAVIPQLLDAAACADLRASYEDGARFRSRVVMQRHNFGRGEYQYFSYPLPDRVQQLRTSLYPQLQPIANAWQQKMGGGAEFPPTHAEYLAQCHAAGQPRPTPLLLRYRADDFNCLHQDLYGALHFPFQAVILLSEPGTDFQGGELVLVEQRPRMQSRPLVVPLRRGDAAIFAVRHRPVTGTRGSYKVALRHGVSRIVGGERFTLGIVFHDAS